MEKINLKDILSFGETYEEDYNTVSINDALTAMKEFGKQLLELAAENAKADIKTEWEGNTGSEYCEHYAIVDKQSILETINQIE